MSFLSGEFQSGDILHTWSTGKNANFSHVKIYENNDLLGGVSDKLLTRLGWNSNIRWIKKIRFHHEITIDENNDIYVLDRMDKMVFRFNLPEQFYSPVGGGCQQLPNGNVLITEEYKGRAFEVTRDCQIVWEYYTPYIEKKNRPALYRMTRITNLENYIRLKELKFEENVSFQPNSGVPFVEQKVFLQVSQR